MYPRTWRAPVAFTVAVALSLTSGCSSNKDNKPKVKNAVEVTTGGGSYTVDGITINVEPQTVQVNTKLTVSQPITQQGATPRPFSEASNSNVQFDISLADGSQPLKPLDVQIPLKGAFLPTGTVAEHALLYSPNTAGEWRLVPSVVENGVLHTKLTHLSPKNISFASPLTIISGVGPNMAKDYVPRDVSNCDREGDTAAIGKVKLAGSGWTRDTSSVIHPCLVEQNGALKLKVTNNNDLMWLMTSSGPAIFSQGNTEAEIVKLITKTFYNDAKVKAYLAEDSDAWIDITSDDLPVTVQLRADPNTFLANSVWVGLKFGVSVLTGTSGSEATERAKKLLNVPGTIDCLTTVVKTYKGNPLDVTAMVDLVLSTCGEKIAESVDATIPDLNLWNRSVQTFFTVVGGINDSLKLLGNAYEGIWQQFQGDVAVSVERAAPQCAKIADFNSANAKAANKPSHIAKVVNIICGNGWASGNVLPTDPNLDPVFMVIHFEKDQWTIKYVGTDFPWRSENPFCTDNKVPSGIRRFCTHM